ncbi:MAG: MoaD/ThiS family protein [Firmicutes bacterium]|jgi:molybdopterin converting factor small subunit|nr:MoaD/ThiS family protein [Bacillota bacterium]
MRVTVKFFGFPSAFGRDNAKTFALPEGATIAQLLAVIKAEAGPDLDAFAQKSSVVVNQARAERDTVLHDGDEVMLMFTLGGG